MSLDTSDKIKLFGILLIAVAFGLGFSLPLILINSLLLLRIWLFLGGFLICLSGCTVFGKRSKWRNDNVIDNMPLNTSYNAHIVESKQSHLSPESLPFAVSFQMSKDDNSEKS